jgi:hypothetical protein
VSAHGLTSSRDEELALLSRTPRVWGNAGPGDMTPGLIRLCRDWIKPDCVMAEIGCVVTKIPPGLFNYERDR